MMRARPLLEIGGYRESLIAGEEPELCFRLRQRGHRVMRLDAEMTLHDAAMLRASQWFQRSRRAGHAFAEMAVLHGRTPERPGVRKTASVLFWGLLLPLAALGCGVLVAPALALGLWFAASAFSFSRSYSAQVRRPMRRRSDAALYALACVFSKFPEAVGVLTYARNRLLGRPSTLLEYKTKVANS